MTLREHLITVGSGIVENSVLLGPLSLYSSVRLFAKLAPSLSTSAKARKEFITALQQLPPLSMHIHADVITKLLLQQFGNGNPSEIIYMVQKSTPEKIEQLKAYGNIFIMNKKYFH